MTTCHLHLPECTLRPVFDAFEDAIDQRDAEADQWAELFDAYADGDEFGDYDGPLTSLAID